MLGLRWQAASPNYILCKATFPPNAKFGMNLQLRQLPPPPPLLTAGTVPHPVPTRRPLARE